MTPEYFFLVLYPVWIKYIFFVWNGRYKYYVQEIEMVEPVLTEIVIFFP